MTILSDSIATNKTSSHRASELILRSVQLLCQRRIVWLRHIWTQLNQQNKEVNTLQVEIDGYLLGIDDCEKEQEFFADPSMAALNTELLQVEQQLLQEQAARFFQLVDLFHLNAQEIAVLKICFATAIDADLGRILAYVQDSISRNYVTENLVGRLFFGRKLFTISSGSPLFSWKLVNQTPGHSGEPNRLEIDPFIKQWLLGIDAVDEMLSPYLFRVPPLPALPGWPIQHLVQQIDQTLHTATRVFIAGNLASGRKTMAAEVCRILQLNAMAIRWQAVPENRRNLIQIYVHRFAWITNSAIIWQNVEFDQPLSEMPVASYPLQFFIGYTTEFLKSDNTYIDIGVEIPTMSFEDRLHAWHQWVPNCRHWDSMELEKLIRSYQSPIGQIVKIGLHHPNNLEQARGILLAELTNRLGNLAQPINASFVRTDLVVAEKVNIEIEDFCFEARERIAFWEQPSARRIFPQGRSLIALFTGSPGTGKTMAAQVIAEELKLNIYRVDLSTVVSKYIGESSKNLERILSQARNMNIVLLFDEADALFGKRTEVKDAHDRYANTDTNYLLQAIENYPGIIILSSNKKSGFDPAFFRRFRYVIDFPKPDEAQRLQLWNVFFETLFDKEATIKLQPALNILSSTAEFSGAQIKQAVLSTLFISRSRQEPVTKEHLLKAVEREFIKESKSLSREIIHAITYC